MTAFILRRLIQSILVMLAVALIAFTMFRFVGDPVNSMLPENATAEERQDLREQLGLNAPVTTQFARFVTGAAQGEFGISYRNKRPVSDLIAERLPATLELVLAAAIFALAMGVPMGIYTALHRKGFLSNSMQILSLIGISVPTFVTGILLILVFSVWLNWLPSFGRGDVVQIGWWSTGLLTWSGLKSLVLPAIMLGLFQVTLIMRLVRAEMLETLRSDYVRFARARGLTNRAVHFGHAFRNTLMPVITIVGLQLGAMIAFAIITETVFQWPGMGLLFIQAVSFGDIPVMSAYLVLVALVFVVINMIVDLLYFAIDPRLSIRAGRA
ncbi:ABC transporter permease [Roseovarius indicus]|uniref:ABC transporter permease n=1 Tax=Roseovarius indicus TaxID=540747 RepID=A0A0T5PC65_9RHOB|nr:ABC transporter permease [Roseovarius indicus]KRS18494.1 ABC transporter permease [Roseovarius indicus]QEW25479.1 Dipeptide transport system permease protein DppB [Roseovarius indicus]SFE04528.1 peptide/nickel transport system permease protein [Roseovarius indicus]